jgi:ABC-type phosphate transport system substrate-binding protein
VRLQGCLSILLALFSDADIAGASVPPMPVNVAVIVHLDNPTQDLTNNELRDLLLGGTWQWPNRRNIVVVAREPGSAVLETVLHNCLKTNLQDYNRRLLELEFRGKKPVNIKTLTSDAGACAFVSNVPGAIGFISDFSLSSPSCREQVKVLRISGKEPGSPGYLLNPGSH